MWATGASINNDSKHMKLGYSSCSGLLALFLAGLAGVSCNSPQSRFATESQANLVRDTRESSGGKTLPAQEGAGMPEGVGRIRGRYYYVRNGQATVLTRRERFVQGLTYDGRQRVTLADGNIVRLTEGEMVTFSGDRIPVPPGTEIPR